MADLTFVLQLRFVFPTEPEKQKGKKRDEPAVVVLLVDGPFTAQMAAEQQPKRREKTSVTALGTGNSLIDGGCAIGLGAMARVGIE